MKTILSIVKWVVVVFVALYLFVAIFGEEVETKEKAGSPPKHEQKIDKKAEEKKAAEEKAKAEKEAKQKLENANKEKDEKFRKAASTSMGEMARIFGMFSELALRPSKDNNPSLMTDPNYLGEWKTMQTMTSAVVQRVNEIESPADENLLKVHEYLVKSANELKAGADLMPDAVQNQDVGLITEASKHMAVSGRLIEEAQVYIKRATTN